VAKKLKASKPTAKSAPAKPQKTYTVWGALHVSVFTVVKARSRQEARRIAEQRAVETCEDVCSHHTNPQLETWCLFDGHGDEVEIGTGRDCIEEHPDPPDSDEKR